MPGPVILNLEIVTTMGFPAGLLEAKLDDWSQGISQACDPGEFLRRWLLLTVHTARADIAVVWLNTSAAEWTAVEMSVADESAPITPRVASALPEELRPFLREFVPAARRLSSNTATTVRVHCGIQRAGQPVGLLIAEWPADLWESSQAQLSPYLGASAELLGDFLVQHELQRLRREQTNADRREQFLGQISGVTSVREFAQRVVHDARALTGSDRLCWLQRGPWSWKVIAVSGVDHIDSRSGTVQAWEAAAAEIQQAHTEASSRPSAHPAGGDGLDHGPIEIRQRLSAVTHSEQVDWLTFSTPAGTMGGLLIAERFPGASTQISVADWTREFHRLQSGLTAPWRAAVLAEQRWWHVGTFWQRWSHWHRLGLAVGLLLLGGGLLAWVPVPLVITAEGTLLPKQRRDVFARTSGVVANVLVDHGQTVAIDQPLLQLHDPENSLELTRVKGELATISARLQVVQAARISLLATGSEAAMQAQQLAAEEAELSQRVDSLTLQQQLLKDEESRLQVISPIAGEVLTWNSANLLAGRPVERGQVLLSVGDVSGPWVVECRVRERDLPELETAWQLNQEPENFVVEFTSATALDRQFRGRLLRIARIADLDERGENTVRVTVAVINTDAQGSALPMELRPGTTVFLRIDCGSRALGYVWFRDLWFALRRQWWLRF